MLEREMATHYSVLAWRIPQTEKPGRLQSMGSQTVGHDGVTNIHTHMLDVLFCDLFYLPNIFCCDSPMLMFIETVHLFWLLYNIHWVRTWKHHTLSLLQSMDIWISSRFFFFSITTMLPWRGLQMSPGSPVKSLHLPLELLGCSHRHTHTHTHTYTHTHTLYVNIQP